MSAPKFGHLEDGPWTLRDLKALYQADLNHDLTPGEVSWKAQHSIPACDLARWTLLGRSYEEALEILNGQGHGGERYSAVVAQ